MKEQIHDGNANGLKSEMESQIERVLEFAGVCSQMVVCCSVVGDFHGACGLR